MNGLSLLSTLAQRVDGATDRHQPLLRPAFIVRLLTRGLGFETARRLAKLGVKVLLGARDEERGKEAEAKLKGEGLDAEFILIDMTDSKTHERAAQAIGKKFGRLDILVNNAGVNLEGSADLDIQAASQTPAELPWQFQRSDKHQYRFAGTDRDPRL